MRVIKDTPFEVGYLVSQTRPPRYTLTLVAKATFDIVHDGECTLSEEQRPVSGETYWDDDFAQSLRYDSDLAILKPRGEFYLTGTCHPAGGRAIQSTKVSLKVGATTATMAVFGDRVWRGALPTEPTPFTSMPLRYERSFGGPGFAANPVGRGATETKGTPRALPNLENPRALIAHPTDRPAPAAMFPSPPTWRQRLAFAGTYDAHWLASRWPQLPDNFDYAYFNAAPVEQQIQGYFNGSEEIVAQHLHPEHAKWRTRLPAWRARMFVHAQGDFREVVANLDTIAVDTDEGKVVCAWRGVTPALTEKLTDIEHVFALHEPTGKPTPLDACRSRFEHQLALDARPAAGARTDAPPPDDDDAGLDEPEREVKLHMAQARLMALTLEWGVRDPAPPDQETLRATDVTMSIPIQDRAPAPAAPDVMPKSLDETWVFDDDEDAPAAVRDAPARPPPRGSTDETVVLDGPSAKSPKPRAIATISETIMRSSADDTVLFAAGEAPKRAPSPPDDAPKPRGLEKPSEVLARLTASGLKLPSGVAAIAAMEQAVGPEPAHETIGERLRGLRQRVLSAHAAGESLAGEDLTGVDLSRDELASIDLRGAVLTRAVLRGANLEGAKLEEAVLAGANLQGARLRGAAMSKADLTGITAARASFEAAVLSNAAISGADLAYADLRTATLDGADLAGTDLTAADLSGTVLDGANLSRATLAKARFGGASMKGCAIESANAREAKFDKADLSKANLSERSDFRGASFVEVKASQANLANALLDHADLSRGEFDRADFGEASLVEAKLAGCNLRSASFREAKLVRAELLKCDAMEASFEAADLRHADLRGANLFGADFVRANTKDARLELANVKRTRIG